MIAFNRSMTPSSIAFCATLISTILDSIALLRNITVFTSLLKSESNINSKVFIHIYTCFIHTCVFVCVYIHMCIYIVPHLYIYYIYIHTHHTHTHVQMYIYICTSSPSNIYVNKCDFILYRQTAFDIRKKFILANN